MNYYTMSTEEYDNMVSAKIKNNEELAELWHDCYEDTFDKMLLAIKNILEDDFECSTDAINEDRDFYDMLPYISARDFAHAEMIEAAVHNCSMEVLKLESLLARERVMEDYIG